MKRDKNALAAAVAEWPQRVKDAGVKLDDGRAYRPVKRNNTILEHLDDPTALHSEMVRILDADGWDDPNTGSKGWDRIVAQAGPAYLWEWLIMDRTTDWAGLFTDEHRWKVAVAVAHTLKRL
jgi:hypothetical protein